MTTFDVRTDLFTAFVKETKAKTPREKKLEALDKELEKYSIIDISMYKSMINYLNNFEKMSSEILAAGIYILYKHNYTYMNDQINFTSITPANFDILFKQVLVNMPISKSESKMANLEEKQSRYKVEVVAYTIALIEAGKAMKRAI